MNSKKFSDFFEKITPKVDTNEMLDAYKKNLEFITTCNKLIMSTMQNIYNMNIDFFNEQSKNAKSKVNSIATAEGFNDKSKAVNSAISDYVKDYTKHLKNIQENLTDSGSKMKEMSKAKVTDIKKAAKASVGNIKSKTKSTASKAAK